MRKQEEETNDTTDNNVLQSLTLVELQSLLQKKENEVNRLINSRKYYADQIQKIDDKLRHITGRLVNDKDLETNGPKRYYGRMTYGERPKIVMSFLTDKPPQRFAVIASATKVPQNSLAGTLNRLMRNGKVKKLGPGLYAAV